MTEPQPDTPPAPSDDQQIPTGEEFMSTFYTPDLISTENRGEDRVSDIHESRG